MTREQPARPLLRLATSALALAALVLALTTVMTTAQGFDPRRKAVARPAPAAARTVRAVRPPTMARPAARGAAVNRAAIGARSRPAYAPAMGLRRPAATTAAHPARMPATAGRGLPVGGRGLTAGPNLRRPGLAARPGLRQPLGARGLASPGRGLRPLVRPAMLRPGFGRPAFAALPRAAGRFGASPRWAAVRQRFFVPPPISLGPPPGRGFGRSRHEMEVSGVPPAGERRFLANEVVVQIDRQVARADVERLTRQLGVTVVASHSLDASGRTLYHFRSAPGRDVSDVVRRLEQDNVVAAAQPNYVYTLDQAVPTAVPAQPSRQPRASLPPRSPAPPASQPVAPASQPPLAGLPPRPLPLGDPNQYAIGTLHLGDVHRLARGRNIRIAVVDSAVDSHHPDLAGAIAESVDPSGQPSRPHPHGTGMAGAIAAHARLLGVAPEASVVAIKVFDERKTSAEATSFQILKGLDEAMRRGVKIINMSFAGPYDVMLERKLREAYEKGIVLIAAAGNAGPDSPPLYPAADPSVIAVTATDAGNKTFAMANRGAHVGLAAPGVDILVPSPGGTYQLTTGTSVAAAHVSGVVALMLEKRPDLTPEDVRAILVGSATPIASSRADDSVGLIDPLKALTYEPPDAETPATASAANDVGPGPTPAAVQGAAPAAPAAAAGRSAIEQRWPRP